MNLVLFQPEIAANVGAVIRIAACFAARLHIVEPCGFPLKAKEIDRVALDYGALVTPIYHASWSTFSVSEAKPTGRLVLMTTKTDMALSDIAIRADDSLLIGQESAGVSNTVRDACDVHATIPLAPAARSLNMAVCAGIALAEARRQIGYR